MSLFWRGILTQISLVAVAGFILQEVFKNLLDKQVSKLEAKLSLNTQQQLNWKVAEREAIIEYNKKISEQIYIITSFQLNEYNIDNYKEIKNIDITLRKINMEVDLSEEHLSLFLQDSLTLEAIRLLKVSIDEYEKMLLSATISLTQTYNFMSAEIIKNPQNRDSIVEKGTFESTTLKSTDFYALFGKSYEVKSHHADLIKLLRNRVKKISDD